MPQHPLSGIDPRDMTVNSYHVIGCLLIVIRSHELHNVRADLQVNVNTHKKIFVSSVLARTGHTEHAARLGPKLAWLGKMYRANLCPVGKTTKKSATVWDHIMVTSCEVFIQVGSSCVEPYMTLTLFCRHVHCSSLVGATVASYGADL